LASRSLFAVRRAPIDFESESENAREQEARADEEAQQSTHHGCYHIAPDPSSQLHLADEASFLDPTEAILMPHVLSVRPRSPEQHDAEKARPQTKHDHRQGMFDDSSIAHDVRHYPDDE
jgi:hypothetical protein